MAASKIFKEISPELKIELCNLLDSNENWQRLALCVKDRFGKNKFNHDDLDLIGLELQRPNGSPAKTLLDLWSYDNPNTKDVIETFEKVKLNRLAELIRRNIPTIKEHNICLNNNKNPTEDQNLNETNAKSKFSEKAIGGLDSDNSFQLDPLCSQDSKIGKNQQDFDDFNKFISSVKCFEIDFLSEKTKNFNKQPILKGGSFIGEGSFGEVFYGEIKFKDNNSPKAFIEPIAVKKMKSSIVFTDDRQFKSEISSLSKYKHKNLVSLYGYSNDGKEHCLVYSFMVNGSLEEKLSSSADETLQQDQRFNVLLGAASGINYLHTAFDQPLVHRDIKSANILLDDQMNARISDFGLARDSLGSITQHVMGTPAYMPPESIRNKVSGKWDVFSYGVVVLETLTGLPAAKPGEQDLSSTIEDECENVSVFIDEWLDKAIVWDKNKCSKFYGLSQECLEEKPEDRPSMKKVLEFFDDIAFNSQS